MADPATLTLVGIIVLAVLIVIFFKVRQKDLIGAIAAKRQAGSRIVSRAYYVEGMEKIPVALSLGADALYYENPDLEASFDLNRVDEVEYSDDLATGRMHDENLTVLRLRSHGQAFEFLLDKPDAKKWMALLPARASGESPAARAV